MTFDVRCDSVSKRYRLTGGRRQDFWALQDVSFEVARGEALGIIGRNGAGKSTILKLLSGITAPTAGEIAIRGRLAALIEIGSGFHPELTGRENAFLSGSILGLRRRQIADRLPSILDFAGIGTFLDTPVKFYSSGMYVRLGFAIAAHLDPDVLLVDEVLAVGDAEFQARCLRRIDDLKARGVTMILVSHDLGAVEQLCDRAVLLEKGRIVAAGAGHDVVTAYQRLAPGRGAPIGDAAAEAGAPVHITALTLRTPEGREILSATSGEPLIASVAIHASAPFDDVEVAVSLYDYQHGQLIAECSSRAAGGPLPLAPGDTAVEFVFPELLLAPGVYTLGATVTPACAARPRAWRFGRTTLYVEGTTMSRGPFLLPYECRITTPSRSAALAS